MRLPEHRLWQRLLEYVNTTGVTVSRVPRRSEAWKPFGLPDTRGFVPQLRTVNLGIGEKKGPFSETRWLAHDLFHVLFYDFAVLNLGADAFDPAERMLETHLASEAFAVYALDYRVLSAFPRKTLTIDLDSRRWAEFQKLNPKLDDIETPEFCRSLVHHYLTGEADYFSSSTKNESYLAWAGHEIRYAVKQRYYAQMWADDLLGIQRDSGVAADVQGSCVDEAVFELTEVLLESTGAEWSAFLRELSAAVRGPRGLGVFQEKMDRGSAGGENDYRFTDMLAVSRADVFKQIERAHAPSAPTLFLFWQILATEDPRNFSAEELKQIGILAASSNTGDISISAWRSVRSLASRTLQNFRWHPLVERRATFFLP